jgi:hypothetical protein
VCRWLGQSGIGALLSVSFTGQLLEFVPIGIFHSVCFSVRCSEIEWPKDAIFGQVDVVLVPLVRDLFPGEESLNFGWWSDH